MGWLSKIFKGSSHKVSEGQYDWNDSYSEETVGNERYSEETVRNARYSEEAVENEPSTSGVIQLLL